METDHTPKQDAAPGQEIVLTGDQLSACRTALEGKDVCILGGPGTGKTETLLRIIDDLRENGKRVITGALTARAAEKVQGATIHSIFSFPMGVCLTDSRNQLIRRTSEVLLNTDVLVLDEISMIRMDIFDSLCQCIERAEIKAGHPIQLIVCGDFSQLPPVKEDLQGKKRMDDFYGFDTDPPYAFRGIWWEKRRFAYCMLNRCIRQRDEDFIRNLHLLREGNLSCIPWFNEHTAPEMIPDAICIAARRSAVDEINRQALRKLDGEEVTIPPDISGTLDGRNTAPLVLKPGAPVIITVNDTLLMKSCAELLPLGQTVSYDRTRPRFSNGTSGTVVEVQAGEHPCAVVSVKGVGKILFRQVSFPVWDYVLDENGIPKRTAVGHVTQLPLRLAFAETIHQAQGSTYDAVNINPSSFAPYQAFVALSRGKSIDRIHLIRPMVQSDVITEPYVDEFYRHVSEVMRQSQMPPGEEKGPVKDQPRASADPHPGQSRGPDPHRGQSSVPDPVSDTDPESGVPLLSVHDRGGYYYAVHRYTLVRQGKDALPRSFLVIKNRYGIVVRITRLHRFTGLWDASSTMPEASDAKTRLHYICQALNYCLIRCYPVYGVDHLFGITKPMLASFFQFYAQDEKEGGEPRGSESVRRCISSVTLFFKKLSLYYGDPVTLTPDKLYARTASGKWLPDFQIRIPRDTEHIYRDFPVKALGILLNLSWRYDPMLTLMIASGSFAGTRTSETVNIRQIDSPLGAGLSFVSGEGGKLVRIDLDLRHEYMLRSDGVSTGLIKRERIQGVYTKYLDAYFKLYRNHLALLKETGFEKEYGPMFVDTNGMAMTEDAYRKRFQKLVDNHLRPVLLAHSDPELRHFGMILCEEKLSPQTCRHIFTVLLVLEGESEASIQDWRGDRSPESSHLYMQEKGDLMRRANGAQGAFTTFAINEGEKYIGEE